MIIGLTGGIGSGKSTAAKIIEKQGYAIVDADKVSRSVTEKGSGTLIELSKAFGEDILLPDGSLDRKKLANRAFATKEKTALLDHITGPAIRKKCLSEIDRLSNDSSFKGVIFDCPLLFEYDYDKICDMTILVTAPLELRISRVIERDKVTKEQVLDRISKQMSEDEKAKRANLVISNDSDVLDLEKKILSKLPK